MQKQHSKREIAPERRVYVITLQRGISQKRLFLEGEDTTEAKERLGAAMQEINQMQGESWLDFLSNATRHLRRAGFTRIPH